MFFSDTQNEDYSLFISQNRDLYIFTDRRRLVTPENNENPSKLDRQNIEANKYPLNPQQIQSTINAFPASQQHNLISDSSNSSTSNTNRFVDEKIGRKIWGVGVIYN